MFTQTYITSNFISKNFCCIPNCMGCYEHIRKRKIISPFHWKWCAHNNLPHGINIRRLSKPIFHTDFEFKNNRTNQTRGVRKRLLRLCRGEKFFAPLTLDNAENYRGICIPSPIYPSQSIVYRLSFIYIQNFPPPTSSSFFVSFIVNNSHFRQCEKMNNEHEKRIKPSQPLCGSPCYLRVLCG